MGDEMGTPRESDFCWRCRPTARRLRLMHDAAFEEARDAARRGYERGVREAAAVVESQAGHYPTDIFPNNSAASDAFADSKAAAFARHMARVWGAHVRALLDGQPGEEG